MKEQLITLHYSHKIALFRPRCFDFVTSDTGGVFHGFEFYGSWAFYDLWPGPQTEIPVWGRAAILHGRYHVMLDCSLDRSSPGNWTLTAAKLTRFRPGGVRSSHLIPYYCTAPATTTEDSLVLAHSVEVQRNLGDLSCILLYTLYW